MPKETRDRESEAGFEIRGAIATLDTRPSSEHENRNDDAILGDTGRLAADFAKLPDLQTDARWREKDERTMLEAMKKENEMADKLVERGIYGILDGVSAGGKGEGALASRLASAEIAEVLSALPPDADTATTERAIEKALRQANDRVTAYKTENDRDQEETGDLRGSSTTADIVRVVERKDGRFDLVYGHAGDSKIYVLRKKTGQVECITSEQNMLWAFKEGKLGGPFKKAREYFGPAGDKAADEAYQKFLNDPDDQNNWPEIIKPYFRFRNQLVNAVGRLEGQFEPVVGHVELEEGDKVLLATDGLFDGLKDKGIERLLQSGASLGEMTAEASRLMAENKAKNDDISGVLIEMGGREKGPSDAETVEEKINAWKAEAANGAEQIAAYDRLLSLAAPIKTVDGKPSRGPISPEDRAAIEKCGGPKGIEALKRAWQLYTLERQLLILRNEVGAETLAQIDSLNKEAASKEKQAASATTKEQAAKLSEDAKAARQALEYLISSIPSAQDLRGVQEEIRRLKAEQRDEDERKRLAAERQARKNLE